MEWFSAVIRCQPRPRPGCLCRCHGADTNTGRCLRLRLWWNWPIYNAVRIHYPACSLPPSTALARCTAVTRLSVVNRDAEEGRLRRIGAVLTSGSQGNAFNFQQPQPQRFAIYTSMVAYMVCPCGHCGHFWTLEWCGGSVSTLNTQDW